jgi:3-oxoacyl-[acyl-carrier-protein] synthase II
VAEIRAFDCTGFTSRIAAEVDEGSLRLSERVTPAKLVKLMSRATGFAVEASAQAREHARLGDDDVDPERMAICLGASGMGPSDYEMIKGEALAMIDMVHETGARHFDVPAFARTFTARTNPVALLKGLPNIAASHVAIQQRARGPSSTITTACTSGTQAIGDALRLLRADEADVVLAGGTDAPINPAGVLGFSLLGTLSRRNESPEAASRPFDLDRDGFVLGEGAGILMLERESFARARGAPILAEISGYAATCDAYRITDERPDASGAVSAMRGALRSAEASGSDVDYVNAHGTGTEMNDRLETQALHEVLGAHAPSVPVSSTKSMIGHLLAAAGGVEAAACVLSITDGFVPPTINYDTPDPHCDLDYVPNEARETRIDVALSNSIGFGGQNACLVIRRP